MENAPEENSDASNNKNIIWVAVALAALGLAVAVFGLVQANDAKKSVDSQKTSAENSQQINAEKISVLEKKVGTEVSGIKRKEEKSIQKFEKGEKKKIRIVTAEAKSLQEQINTLSNSLLREKRRTASLSSDLDAEKTNSAASAQKLQKEIDALKKEVSKLKKAINSIT